MLGVASDVTARREAEEELRRSRELYRLVVETSEDLITLIDLEGELVYVSPSHERSLGFAPDELRELGLDQLVHPDELPAVRALLESAAAREERPALEARIRSRSGAWVRIEGVATPILDEDGSPVMSSPRRVT